MALGKGGRTMPWIPKQDRGQYEPGLQELVPKLTHEKIGDLTYILYEIPVRIFARKMRWTTACLLLGAMLGALLCFFIKHVWNYEADRLAENGETEGDRACSH